MSTRFLVSSTIFYKCTCYAEINIFTKQQFILAQFSFNFAQQLTHRFSNSLYIYIYILYAIIYMNTSNRKLIYNSTMLTSLSTKCKLILSLI